MAVVTLLVPVSTLRLPMAIALAADEQEAQAIARAALQISALVCMMLLVCLVLVRFLRATSGAEVWDAWPGRAAADPGIAIFCIPAAVFVLSLNLVMTSLALRRAEFGRLAQSAPVQSLTVSLVRLLAGLLAPVSATLVIIATGAPLVQVAWLRRPWQISERDEPHHRCRRPALPRQLRDARRIVSDYRTYPLCRLPADLLHAALHALPVLLFAGLYGPAAAGYLALARGLLASPVHLAGQSLGQALLPEYAALARDRRPLLPQMMQATRVLLLLSGVLFAAAMTAPAVLPAFPGGDWAAAGPVIAWMSLPACAALANQAVIRAAPVVGAQALHLFAHAACLALYLLAFGAVRSLGAGMMAGVVLMSVAGTACQLGLMLGVIRRTRLFDQANAAAGISPDLAGDPDLVQGGA